MKKGLTFLIAILIMITPIPAIAANDPIASLAQMTVKLTGLDQSGKLIYIGIDIAVFEETGAGSGDPNDLNGDGKVFRVKEGKVKRIITNSANLTIDLGSPSEYKKAVRHKLAMRTLYRAAGVGAGEIIIAGQNNGKDGWIVLPGSEFELSYFVPAGDDDSIIKHTDKWEANRNSYNQSKQPAGIVPKMTKTRPKNTFWSGEKLLVEIRATETLSPSGIMRVSLYEPEAEGMALRNMLDIKIWDDDPELTGGAIYRGVIWDADMLNKWGNHKPKTLTVKVEAIIGGDVAETIYSAIVMDNRDLFYRIKKVY